MASFEDWLDAFDAVYEAIPDDAGRSCPNCGHDRLNLVFTGDPERMIGYAHFWCDNCREGVGISRVEIPPDAAMRDIHDAPEQRSPRIPNYRLVH
jgi:hypothetical protein